MQKSLNTMRRTPSEREIILEVESACDRFIQEYRLCMKGFNGKHVTYA